MINVVGEFERAGAKVSMAQLHEAVIKAFKELEGIGLDGEEIIAMTLGGMGDVEKRVQFGPIVRLWYERWKNPAKAERR